MPLHLIFNYAAEYHITPKQAVVLPALFERIAEVTNAISIQDLVNQARSNKELGDYIKSVALEIA